MRTVTVANKRALYTYYITLILYECGRVLPHAVLTLILLNKGIQLHNIAFIQMFYMAAVILFEFPSGVWSDMYNRKYMYIGSLLLIGLSYSLVLFYNSLLLMCLAWFLYGLSTAIKSGTVDIMFTNYFKRIEDNRGLKNFMGNVRLYNSLAGIIAGFLGGLLYGMRELPREIYTISLGLFLASTVISIIFLPSDSRRDTTSERVIVKSKKHVSKIFTAIKNSNLVIILLLLSVAQFFYQPFFNYWQKMLEGVGIDLVYYGAIYVVFRLISMVAAYLFKKIDLDVKRSKTVIYCGLILLLGLSVINYLFIGESYFFLVYIMSALCIVEVYSICIEYEIVRITEEHIMSSVVSLVGTFVRVFSLAVLLMCNLLLQITDVYHVMYLSVMIFLGAFIIMYRCFLRKNRNAQIKES